MKTKGLICIMLLLSSMYVKCIDFQQDGFYFNILSDKISVEVTCSDNMAGSYSGDVVIPESVTYEGVIYRVTAIGEVAFFKCNGLTSVSIPSSVTYIGTMAFFGCTSLKEISLPDNIELLGTRVFANCTGLETINMPAKIHYIWKGIFDGCTNLAYINIPSLDNFVRFEFEVFKDCHNIKEINIPAGSKQKVMKMLPKRLWNVIKEKQV